MPRKAKEKIIEKIVKNEEVLKPTNTKRSVKSKEVNKKEVAKKTAKNKENISKKSAVKSTAKKDFPIKEVSKGDTKKEAAKKVKTSNEVKKANLKKAEKEVTKTTKKSVAKSTEKKASVKKVPTKGTSDKNVSTKKASTKKEALEKTSKISSSTKIKKSNRKSNKKLNIIGEYYDLPSTYEQTIVKILAQTPTILFVYWDVSNKDKQKLLKQYGNYFFDETTPYLLVNNKTKGYQFEVDVNDYANSWYLHIPDSDCEYEVTLMRRNKIYKENTTNNIYITSSNMLETPNDHILFEKLGKTVFFKDVKTNKISEKGIYSFEFMHNIGKIYNIYDLYKEIYKDELNGDELGIKLSSSQFSSTFK